MNNHVMRVVIGLITFLIGFCAAFAWNFSNSTTCFVEKEPHKSFKGSTKPKSDQVEFVFKKFTQDDDYKRAEFVLINGTESKIFYKGYPNIENSYCTVEFKQNKKVKRGPLCCGTGLVTKVLESGEEKVFTVFLMDWKDVNQVGFHIFDESQNVKIIWSNKFKSGGRKIPSL